MEPRLKWNKNVLAWVTYGGGSSLKFFKIILYINMEPHLKWNKIVLASETILFYFRHVTSEMK